MDSVRIELSKLANRDFDLDQLGKDLGKGSTLHVERDKQGCPVALVQSSPPRLLSWLTNTGKKEREAMQVLTQALGQSYSREDTAKGINQTLGKARISFDPTKVKSLAEVRTILQNVRQVHAESLRKSVQGGSQINVQKLLSPDPEDPTMKKIAEAKKGASRDEYREIARFEWKYRAIVQSEKLDELDKHLMSLHLPEIGSMISADYDLWRFVNDLRNSTTDRTKADCASPLSDNQLQKMQECIDSRIASRADRLLSVSVNVGACLDQEQGLDVLEKKLRNVGLPSVLQLVAESTSAELKHAFSPLLAEKFPGTPWMDRYPQKPVSSEQIAKLLQDIVDKRLSTPGSDSRLAIGPDRIEKDALKALVPPHGNAPTDGEKAIDGLLVANRYPVEKLPETTRRLLTGLTASNVGDKEIDQVYHALIDFRESEMRPCKPDRQRIALQEALSLDASPSTLVQQGLQRLEQKLANNGLPPLKFLLNVDANKTIPEEVRDSLKPHCDSARELIGIYEKNVGLSDRDASRLESALQKIGHSAFALTRDIRIAEEEKGIAKNTSNSKSSQEVDVFELGDPEHPGSSTWTTKSDARKMTALLEQRLSAAGYPSLQELRTTFPKLEQLIKKHEKVGCLNFSDLRQMQQIFDRFNFALVASVGVNEALHTSKGVAPPKIESLAQGIKNQLDRLQSTLLEKGYPSLTDLEEKFPEIRSLVGTYREHGKLSEAEFNRLQAALDQVQRCTLSPSSAPPNERMRLDDLQSGDILIEDDGWRSNEEFYSFHNMTVIGQTLLSRPDGQSSSSSTHAFVYGGKGEDGHFVHEVDGDLYTREFDLGDKPIIVIRPRFVSTGKGISKTAGMMLGIDKDIKTDRWYGGKDATGSIFKRMFMFGKKEQEPGALAHTDPQNDHRTTARDRTYFCSQHTAFSVQEGMFATGLGRYGALKYDAKLIDPKYLQGSLNNSQYFQTVGTLPPQRNPKI